MKITIYELLGLIKDGKAPLNIEFNFKRYYLNYEGEYVRIDEELIYLSKEYNILTCLNEEVVIIEEVEDKEYEDIEELTINGKEVSYGAMNEWLCLATNNEKKICSAIEGMAITINKLIKNQKYILERLDK